MSDFILLLGDQLSPHMASLAAAPDAPIVMAEVYDEASYVGHHKQKLVLVFSAMRHFAEQLRETGRQVHYFAYGERPDITSLFEAVMAQHADTPFDRLLVCDAGEYRLAQAMRAWANTAPFDVEILPDNRFLASPDEFAAWADGRKQLRMEFFYRDMRRRTGLLMDGDDPHGGQWNFDSDNRKKLPKGHQPPARLITPPDAITRDVMAVVETHFANHFGTLEGFSWPVSAADAERQFGHFLDFCLPHFGDYQDAMKTGETLLYHSLIAAALNLGLLDPLAVCQAAEARYHDGHAPLNAVEGFIRQIIGWREFIRGVYWLHMPDYAARNYFEHTRPLPDFYYSADTDMACLREAVTATRDLAYAHHIQRLMVTGNFALLAGLDPAAVNQWYLEVYADAYEWVQLPNTHGMALFADGGVVGSKPYAASGAYINRMSDYCGQCAYQVKQPHGPDACPFNYLYWDFLTRQRDKLGGNPRMGMIYRTYDKMDDARKQAIADSAAAFLEKLT